MLRQRIRKAVFPVAVTGSPIFRPAGAVPTAMLPVVDRPLIRYAVDEAVEAGCDTLIFVTSRAARPVVDYVQAACAPARASGSAAWNERRESVCDVLPPGVRAVFLPQMRRHGLGNAVLHARHAIGDEPFAVLLPDDLVWNRDGVGALAQMVDTAIALRRSVVAVEDVPGHVPGRRSVAELDGFNGRFGRIRGFLDDAHPDVDRGRLGVVGRYVLDPGIFGVLAGPPADPGGAMRLTDAIGHLLWHEPVMAYRFQGRCFDCTHTAGLVEATIRLALGHESIREVASRAVRGALEDAEYWG